MLDKIPPCMPLILVVLIAAIIATAVWWIKQPKALIRVDSNGNAIFAKQIEWLAGFVAIWLLLLAHLAVSAISVRYETLIIQNRASIADTGSYLALTVGALGIEKLRQRRWWKVAFMFAAGTGLGLMTLAKWRC